MQNYNTIVGVITMRQNELPMEFMHKNIQWLSQIMRKRQQKTSLCLRVPPNSGSIANSGGRIFRKSFF